MSLMGAVRNLLGIKGEDGTTIASTTNPIPTQSYGSSREVYADTEIDIRGTSEHISEIAPAAHGNPQAFSLFLQSNYGEHHDQPLGVELRIGPSANGTQTPARIFRESDIVPPSYNSMVLISPELNDGADESNVVQRSVPALRFFPAGQSLFVVVYAAVAPTQGRLRLRVTAHY